MKKLINQLNNQQMGIKTKEKSNYSKTFKSSHKFVNIAKKSSIIFKIY